MENFIFSLNASLPIFITIIIGWILMRIGIFNKEFTIQKKQSLIIDFLNSLAQTKK